MFLEHHSMSGKHKQYNEIQINVLHVCLSYYTPAPPDGGIMFYLCPSVYPKIFFVAFFSATIDGRNLIFGHKLHISMPYCGKRFWTHQIPTSYLPTQLVFIHIEHKCGGNISEHQLTVHLVVSDTIELRCKIDRSTQPHSSIIESNGIDEPNQKITNNQTKMKARIGFYFNYYTTSFVSYQHLLFSKQYSSQLTA